MDRKDARDIYGAVMAKTAKTISHDRYKTTSFTLLREDYAAFQAACRKQKRRPSVVLRALVTIFVQGAQSS